MKKYLIIALFAFGLLLSGCTTQEAQEETPVAGEQPLLGGDEDEHGCIGSAGYSWCETLGECIRPWETECPECITVEDCGLGAARCVDGKCSQYDEHGCVPDGGYTWCESLQECIRPWETECPEEAPIMVGNDSDEHGCIGSAGYSWCEALQQCIRPWEIDCPDNQMVGNDSDEHGCIGSAGYVWCESLGECVRPWETNCTSLIKDMAKGFCDKENVANVYVCGDYFRTVSTLLGGGSTIYDATGHEIVTCPVVSPDSMSPECQQYLFGSDCVEEEVC